MKVEQTTGIRLGRSKPFRVLIITILAVLAMMVFVSPALAADIYVPADHATIQGAINASSNGDTIHVAAGTYSEFLSVNKEVSIVGAGVPDVTINVAGLAGSNGSGIYVSANNVSLQGFTLVGLKTAALPRYGIKFHAVSGGSVSDIVVKDVYRSGFDFLGTASSTIDNVQSINTGGHGIALTDCNGIALSNITTSGNSWQAISVATWGRYTPLGTSGIVFSGTNSFSEVFQLEEGDFNNPGVPPAGEAVITYSNNPADAADVTVPAGDFAYALHGTQDDSPGQNRVYFMPTLADAQAAAAACAGGCGHMTGANMYIDSLSDSTQLYVSPGASIQAAINAADNGDTINIAAGTYVENVIVNKSVELAGAGQSSTIIKPATSLPNPCAGSSTCGSITASTNVVAVQANNVVIHGLTVDGDNPTLTSGIVRNGADLDARNGIITNHHAGVFNGTEIYDVTVRNIYLRGIYPSSGGSFNIHDNTVQNVRGDSGSIAIMAWMSAGTISGNTISEANDGIAANHSKGIQFLNNTVTNSGSGVHTDNAGDGGGVADLLQGNDVSDCDPDGYGVWTFVSYIAPVVDNNTVTNCAVGLSAWGGGFSGPLVTTQFTNNIVNGPAKAAGSVGVYITTDTIGWGYTDIAVNFTGNVISGNETGVYMTADAQPWNPTYTARTVTATFAGNEIAGNTVGMDKGIGGTINADAVGNWWGDASGPYNAASNASGTGNSIADGIPFISWLGMAPVSPVVTYQGPTGEVHVSNPVVTATTTGGSAGDLIVQLGVSGQLDPANPWDVTMWTFPCTVTGGDISCSTSGLPEGVFTATVTVIDSKGLTGNDTGSFTIEDNAAPVTTDNADDNWHKTDVTVTLTCTDAVTGCAQTTYEVDGGSTQVGNTVVLSAEGVHTITYRSIDNDNPAHVESDNTATVRIDKTAPVTTDNAPAAWQNSDVTVTLTCDDGTLSGCATTSWSTDKGESGTGDATVTVEGDNTLTYYSTDNAGNAETAHSVHVYIDKTDPAVTYTGPSGTVYTLLASITGTVTDPALSSGINGATGAVMSLDGGSSFTYSCTVTAASIDCPTPGLADGSYDVVIAVTDNAGNTGTATGAFTYDAAGKPDLRLSVKRVYWNSFPDYDARELSVDYLLTNTTVGRSANGVNIVAAVNTNGVSLLTAVPVSVGNIDAGLTGSFSLKYALPEGVSNFKTSLYATASDPAGNGYFYPSPYPGS